MNPTRWDIPTILVMAMYFTANLFTMFLAAMALIWYLQAKAPVVDWDDPDGPGYRLLAITPDRVGVQWVQLRLRLDCPGHTEVAILGDGYASNIENYPFLIDEERRTFIRRYHLTDPLMPGNYQVRITDIAQCNPLFPNRQILRVPFTVPARSLP